MSDVYDYKHTTYISPTNKKQQRNKKRKPFGLIQKYYKVKYERDRFGKINQLKNTPVVRSPSWSINVSVSEVGSNELHLGLLEDIFLGN